MTLPPHSATITPPQKGFAILEVIIAVAICGMVITGVCIAMQRITALSYETQRESALNRIIENELRRAVVTPNISEGTTNKRVEAWEIDLETIVTPLPDLLNMDGQPINSMFSVQVNAVWWEDGEYVKRTAETWRYANLYAR